MSLQVEAECLCRKCPWMLRKDCEHYRIVCLEVRSCSACVLSGRNIESCLKVLGDSK